MNIALILVIGLALVMLLVGFWASKKIKDTDDYFIGGRRMGLVVIMCTQLASFIGGGMTLGWIGNGNVYGLGGIWYGAFQALSYLFIGLVMVKLLRRKGVSITTLPDWFDSMYHNKALNVIIALMCIFAPITWITGQFTAAARMMEGIGLDYQFGVYFIGLVVVVYSVMGGFLAVAYTDTIQCILLLLIFVCTIPFAFFKAGGVGTVMSQLPSDMTQLFAPKGMPSYTIFLWMVSGLVSATGMQYTYQRISASKSDKVAAGGAFGTAAVTVIFAIVTIFVGMCVVGLGLPEGTSADGTWPWFLNNFMPSWVPVIYTVCILMATMSSADSLINSISMNFTHDLYGKYINPKATEKQKLRTGLIASAVMGLLALFWATQGTWMIKIFSLSNTLCAGPMSGAIFVAALKKEKGSPIAMIAGVLVGAAVGFITQKTSLSAIPSGGTVFSFGISFLICLAGSLVFSNKTAEVDG